MLRVSRIEIFILSILKKKTGENEFFFTDADNTSKKKKIFYVNTTTTTTTTKGVVIIIIMITMQYHLLGLDGWAVGGSAANFLSKFNFKTKNKKRKINCSYFFINKPKKNKIIEFN